MSIACEVNVERCNAVSDGVVTEFRSETVAPRAIGEFQIFITIGHHLSWSCKTVRRTMCAHILTCSVNNRAGVHICYGRRSRNPPSLTFTLQQVEFDNSVRNVRQYLCLNKNRVSELIASPVNSAQSCSTGSMCVFGARQ